MAEMYALTGNVLDPWQQDILRDSLGEREDGRWASPEVAIVCARQNGKSAILEARMLAGLFLFGENLQLYNAHLYASSMEMFRRMKSLIRAVPEFDSRVRSYAGSHGSERIELKNGQRLLFTSRAAGTGRGFTPENYLFDEAMVFKESVAIDMIPGLSGRSVTGNIQAWFAGSAVDQFFNSNGLILAGLRRRALRGGDPRLAYFEWSVDRPSPDDVGPEELLDPALVAQANPALGNRISMDWVRGEVDMLGYRGFAVERLSVGDWPDLDAGAGAVISAKVWADLADGASQVQDPVVLAFDVPPDRSMGAIAVAGSRPDGLGHVEVVEHQRGTGWIVDRVIELAQAHKPRAIVCDAQGPAGSLIRALEQAGLDVLPVKTAENAAACGIFYDAVMHAEFRHRGQAAMSAALQGAAKRTLGDAWAWSRKNSAVDISPLVASTLAWWAHSAAPAPESELLVAFA